MSYTQASLRTLVLLVLLMGSGGLLYARGLAPWRLVRRVHYASEVTKRCTKPGAAVSSDLSKIATISLDKRCRLTDIRTGAELWNVDLASIPQWSNVLLRFLDNDRNLAIDNYRQRHILDLKSGTIVANESISEDQRGHQDTSPFDYGGFAYATAPDGSRRITRSVGEGLEGFSLFDHTGHELNRFSSHGNVARGAAFTPDSRRFAIAAHHVELRDAANGELIAALHPFPLGRCFGVAFTPDADHLLVIRYDDTLFYERIRPEAWWGIACLPGFWLTLIFTVAVVWSFIHDRRPPQTPPSV